MSRITATLGGTTRPGVNGVVPKLDNGDLGPRRLPGAPPKPLDRELTEFDVNGALDSLRAKARAEDSVDAPDPQGETAWSYEDNGYLMRWYRIKSNAQIAKALDKTLISVSRRVTVIRAKFAKGEMVKDNLDKNRRVVPRAATPEQEKMIRDMRAAGARMKAIMEATGLTLDQVRYVIRNPRDGDD